MKNAAAAASTSRRIHINQLKQMECYLDVLTDGSEFTGHGTVFLTISRRSPSSLSARTTTTAAAATGDSEIDIDIDPSQDNTILARYALSGLGTLTSRLASDQSFKLSPIRAIFCPLPYDNVTASTGIPSLLLALSSYSMTGNLYVVGLDGTGACIDEIVSLILGRKRVYPKVLCCDVPKRSKNNNDSFNWWKVYDDEFIIVHARSIQNETKEEDTKRNVEVCYDDDDGDGDDIDIESDNDNDSDNDDDDDANDEDDEDDESEISSDNGGNTNAIENRFGGLGVVYIITIKVNCDSNGYPCSFAVLPPNMNSYTSSNVLHPLPEDILKSKQLNRDSNSSAYTIAKNESINSKNVVDVNILDFILHLDPMDEIIRNEKGRSGNGDFIKIHPNIQKLTKNHLVTKPDNTTLDRGLLIRATEQTKLLHSRLPFAFPQSSIFVKDREQKQEGLKNDEEINVSKSRRYVPYRKLVSCSTILLDTVTDQSSMTTSFRFICRRKQILKKIQMGQNEKKLERETELEEKMKKLYSQWRQHRSSEMTCSNDKEIENKEDDKDENEIDLSEEESEDETPSTSDTTIAAMVQPPHKRIKTTQCNTQCNYDNDKPECGSQRNANETKAMLVVLGTGCASPSPLRGSSGYALLLPTMVEENNTTGKSKNSLVLSSIVECGEGAFLTMSRHLPEMTRSDGVDLSFLSSVRLIWISHAHLDHYSELPLLIHMIYANRGHLVCKCYDRDDSQGSAVHRSNYRSTPKATNVKNLPKCKRCGHYLPPVVIAPIKVLLFLNISLNCKHGVCRKKGERFFFSITNRDFDSSPFSRQIREDLLTFSLRRPSDTNRTFNFGQNILPTYEYNPFASLKSVPVEHCPNAYALILGLKLPNPPCAENIANLDSFFQLCYSGDTRPSSNIVRACEAFLSNTRNNVIRTSNRQRISLLLHEATFDDDERGKKEAISKRHSTVQEAVRIATQINADVCLLTHFSQRYPKLPPGHANPSDHKKTAVSAASNEHTEAAKSGVSSQCVGSAFDAMMIPLDDSILPCLIPILSAEIIAILGE